MGSVMSSLEVEQVANRSKSMGGVDLGSLNQVGNGEEGLGLHPLFSSQWDPKPDS